MPKIHINHKKEEEPQYKRGDLVVHKNRPGDIVIVNTFSMDSSKLFMGASLDGYTYERPFSEYMHFKGSITITQE